MKLHYKVFDLHLNDTFKIAHDQRDIQKTLIVGLEHDGNMGFGEATASIYYRRDIVSIIETLEKNRHNIEKFSFHSLEEFIENLTFFSKKIYFVKLKVELKLHTQYGIRLKIRIFHLSNFQILWLLELLLILLELSLIHI